MFGNPASQVGVVDPDKRFFGFEKGTFLLRDVTDDLLKLFVDIFSHDHLADIMQQRRRIEDRIFPPLNLSAEDLRHQRDSHGMFPEIACLRSVPLAAFLVYF